MFICYNLFLINFEFQSTYEQVSNCLELCKMQGSNEELFTVET